MKKIGLGILIGIVVLALSGVALAISNQGAEKSKAPDLEKIEFIHYKKGFAKPETAKVPKPLSCYKFLTGSKVKWTVPPAVKYVINPTSPVPERLLLTEEQVKSAIFNGAEEWDKWTSKELMDNASASTVDYTATYGVQNYKNSISFGDYPKAGVIAVTAVWYNPATKAIVEFDVMFDTDWTWGDLGNTESPPVVGATEMDLQNIATHELGHGVGLADVYETACNVVTMYGYSDYGETQKRTLETPDVTGIQTLYGN